MLKGIVMEISHKILIMAAILSASLSFIGAVYFLPSDWATITGSATNTTTGVANVTILAFTQITLQNNTVDFGSGFVNATGNSCTLESNSSTKTAACQGFNAPAKSAHFVIENSGNVNVTLDINGTFLTARAFLCDGTNGQRNCTLANPEYNWSADDFEAGSCIGGTGVTSFARNLNITAQRICSNFDFNTSKNTLKVPIRLIIPRDSRLGTLNDSILFTGTG